MALPPNGEQDFHFLQAVIEIKYPKAHRYWDKSGELISTIESRLPGLVCQKLTEHGFRFNGSDADGAVGAVVYWGQASIHQGRNTPRSKFIETAESFFRLLADQFEIQTVNRLGHRIWHYRKADSVSEASSWLLSQRLWRYEPRMANRWGEPRPHGIVLRSRLANDRLLRLELDTGELNTGPGRKPGVLVDTDFSTDGDLPMRSLDVARFAQANHRFLRDNLPVLFEDAS
jgi:hypothetical protein